MKAHILFISSLHLTMSSCFGNHLMEIHTFLQLGFLLHVHSLLKSSSHISSLKRFNCRHHPVSYESYDIRRFLGDKTVEFFDEKIRLTPRFEPQTSRFQMAELVERVLDDIKVVGPIKIDSKIFGVFI